MAVPILNQSLGGAKDAPVTYRAFDDPEKMRESIYGNVLESIKTRYPLANTRYRLELDGLKYEEHKPFTLEEQKRAILRGSTLNRKLHGVWRLVDQVTGEVKDTKKGIIARIPYVTPRGTFIYHGNEYVISNQARLRPGVFTRIKENGMIESHFNVKPGTGPSFRMWMEPETGLFRLGVGQSTLKLYPILRAMGVQDKEIEGIWGRELLQKNIEAEDPRAVSRAFSKLVSTRADQVSAIPDTDAAEKVAAAEGDELPLDIQRKIIEFVRAKKGLDDKEFHEFVEGMGVDPHEAEEVVYKAVHEFGSGSQLFGVDPEFDKIYLERSRYSGDLFMPPPEVWETVEVKDSPTHGKGLFARKDIGKDEVITLGYVLDPGMGSGHQVLRAVPVRWTNHAAEPNAVLEQQGENIWMKASKDIGEGQEIFLNYVNSHKLFDKFMREFNIVKQAKHIPTVAIDLDGTLAKMYEKYDAKSIPDPRPGAKGALEAFQEKGYRIIIFTVRGDVKLVREWLNKHEIPFDYINENPSQPRGSSGKVVADVYIDDRAVPGDGSWENIVEEVIPKLEKEAQIGAKASDRKWSKLWFKGTIRAELGHEQKPWVYVEVHKGLVDAAFESLKSQGIECSKAPNNPHITLLREGEAGKLYKDFGPTKWKGAAKDGMPIRFALQRIVNLVPAGWKDIDRVWFLEVESPDLKKYRSDLGLDKIPKHERTGHDMRFHISFAVHRPSSEVKKALYWFQGGRDGELERALSKEAEDEPQGVKLSGVFEKMELDPEVTASTLGKPFLNAGVPTLLRASQKILKVGRGEEDIDDRDSLAYQTLHSPEDFFAERITKDAGQLGRRLLWKSTLRGDLKHISAGVLTKQLDSVLLKSGLGSALEETNPMDVLDMQLRVSRMGEGGIGSMDAVPMESRSVQPSHFGFIDPVRSPESQSVGIDQRVAHGALRGSDGQFYTEMLNRTGKPELVSAIKASNSIVAFPGEMERKGSQVRAMVKARQIEWVDKKEVDYALPSTGQMFSATSNLVPLVSGIKGGRLLMGSKYFQQALPLREREAPLVQSLSHHDEQGNPVSFDDIYGGKVGAVKARDRGVVTDIGPDHITVKYADGSKQSHELYSNFPFNRKTYVHNTPAVKIGDRVGKGQLLASSNYTDSNGSLAIGTNLRTAYMPYKGLNFEDAVVVSESAAKKLSSEHMYQHTLDKDDETVIGRNQFVSIFPGTFKRVQLETIDKNGVVKPGTVVKFGDPLMLSLKKRAFTALHRGAKAMYADGAVKWEHETPGVVTDVDELEGGGYNVTVKSYVPLQEGDKLAGRYGDKGITSRIVPDDQMVHDKDGKPFDILLNPLGIITRGNPSQVFEALLGKVSRAQGAPVKVPSFMKEPLVDYVQKELSRAKLKDTEDLFDPTTGKKIPNVLTGERFIFKLHHTAESKGKGRDIGGYTSEGLPARGGDEGSKRISSMEINALLSHGALNVLRDAQVVRGQRNDDFWRAFRLGFPPPSPKVPMIYEKFMNSLKAAGVNVKKDGNRLNILALTDKDIAKMSSGAIKFDQTVENDTLQEIPGGLFDRTLTGGHGGNRWSHIPLQEPMPNPIMEEPIRRMLGLTVAGLEEVIEGKKELAGQTGPGAILAGLKRIKLDSAIEQAKTEVEEGSQSKRDNAVKLLGYYKMMEKTGIKPTDLMLHSVPVLPPAFRPITQTKGMPVTAADPNLLYRDLMHANDDLKEVRAELGDQAAGQERLRLYNAFKAVTGLGDPVHPKTREKQVKGLLKQVFGSAPKYGSYQRKVLGAPVDVVGRAVVTPNPSLGMDQVGIPEDKAWTIYRPFIMRRLVRAGMPATQAALSIANQSDVAKKALVDEMGERPVMINRAPTLHRYGFMAAWPVLTKGSTLQVSPVTVTGYNMDFDGDAANYHVPVLDEAVQEAVEKMMPSRNLKAVKDFQVHYLPRNEFMLGLYLASSADKKGQKRIFKDKASAIGAYQRGEIGVGDRVVIPG